jgi:hypothetical protein
MIFLILILLNVFIFKNLKVFLNVNKHIYTHAHTYLHKYDIDTYILTHGHIDTHALSSVGVAYSIELWS